LRFFLGKKAANAYKKVDLGVIFGDKSRKKRKNDGKKVDLYGFLA
jgi:hypothetical protein